MKNYWQYIVIFILWMTALLAALCLENLQDQLLALIIISVNLATVLMTQKDIHSSMGS